MKYYSPLTITGRKRSVTLPNRVFLAPMAGVSDLPFRLLCHEQRAGLVCMEMVSAKAITYRNRNTTALLRTNPEEHPVSLQLFGHEPEVIAEALELIESGEAGQCDFDLLDLNMGCPVPKITGNGDGSALMKDPALIERLVRAAVEHTTRPVTVKLRLGFDEQHRNAVECALAAEAGGASMVAVHGRTRPQMYSGEADLSGIAAVCRAVHIPVTGNGDVKDGKAALRMFQETGCDAVMVGRAAEGNPWIFREINEFLRYMDENPGKAGTIGDAEGSENGTISDITGSFRNAEHSGNGAHLFTRGDVTPAERKTMILRHTDLLLSCKPERIAMQEMRKHVAWYIAGFPGASRIRSQVMNVNTREELVRLLEENI